MNINYTKCEMVDVNELLNVYFNSLTCVVDDFWESHLTGGQFYKILDSENIIGCFCIYKPEKIVMFTVISDYLNYARTIFKDILEKFDVKTGFAVTGDELMVSLCMENHTRIEMQAIFFNGATIHAVRPPEFERSCIHRIYHDEFDKMHKLTDNFFGFVKDEMIYKLEYNDEILGYGIIVPNVLLPQYWACGMITVEKYRCKGVGRSIQIHLGDICRENGKIPISGCWYYNDLSRKTIESAGRYTTTRLLNVIFND